MLLYFDCLHMREIILSIILAATVLDEEITLVKCIGVLGIIAGVLLIAGGDEVDHASV